MHSMELYPAAKTWQVCITNMENLFGVLLSKKKKKTTNKQLHPYNRNQFMQTLKKHHLFSVCVCAASCACFENINLFHCDWYIWEQFEHNQILRLLICTISSTRNTGSMQKIVPSWTDHSGTHKTDTLQPLPAFSGTVSHTHSHLGDKFLISDKLLLPFHKNSQAAALLTPLPQEKFRTLPKSSSMVITAFRC